MMNTTDIIKNKKKFISTISIIAIVMILLLCSFTTVKSGEVGLKVRFGKIVDTQITEGVNFKLPFVEKIVRVNIKVQKKEETIESSTKDLQIVNTTSAVNFHVDGSKAANLYKVVGTDYVGTILIPAIREATKTAIAQYDAEEITINRSIVSESCLQAIQAKVDKYGIIIDDFNLTDFSFANEYTKAIEERKVAEQNLEKAKLEAEAKITKAKGEADANALLEESLTKEILVEKWIEKWDGVTPKVSSGNTMIDISELLK